MDPSPRAAAFEAVLREAGHQPKIDKATGELYFKTDGKTFIVAIDREDDLFIRLIYPEWWKISSPEEQQWAEAAALHATAKTKVAKVLVLEDSVWSSVELFLTSPEQLLPILERSLAALESSVAHFLEKMPGQAGGSH